MSDSLGCIRQYGWGHDAFRARKATRLATGLVVGAGTLVVLSSQVTTGGSGSVRFSQRPVVVAPVSAAGTPVSFVADAAVTRSTSSPWIEVPAAAQPGDRLLLVLSRNATGRQVSAPTGVTGWSADGSRVARSMQTRAWSKTVAIGHQSTRLDTPLESTLQIAVYHGVAPGPTSVTSQAATTSSTERTTPAVTAPDGAVVVSYWAGKSTGATTFTPGPEVIPRGSAANSGSGRITSGWADSGNGFKAGPNGARTAVSDAATSAATTWAWVLPSAPSTSHDPVPVPMPVSADAETVPGNSIGDSVDEPAIWVDLTDPGGSLVLGNDKQGALEVYDPQGNRVQRITTTSSFWGNLDIRQGVQIGGRTLDVVVGYNAGLSTYAVDPGTRRLQPVGDGSGAVPTGGGEGLCADHSAQTGDLSVMVINRAGRVRQYVIDDPDGDGLLEGTLVREFFVGSESEGCVADDQTGGLYVAEEDVGLWRYGAEPSAGSTRVRVDAVRPHGHLAYDVEGITLASTGPGAGYVIASAQNGAQPTQSYFAIYGTRTNAYVSSFDITSGATADGCERTDGIATYAGNLGPDIPAGLIVCQDNANTALQLLQHEPGQHPGDRTGRHPARQGGR